jgi:hypothetical protein
MIKGISNTIAGFEQIYALGCLVVDTDQIELLMTRADLDAGQQTTYDNFIGLGNDKNWFNIDNTTCMLSFDRLTSTATVEDTEDLDYDAMSAPDKAKVDAFVQLITDLLAQ